MRLLLAAATILCAAAAAGADLKDPTRPPAPPAASAHPAPKAPLPRVTAIFVSDERRVAIFNAQPVRVGDSVGKYRIEAILADGVRYSSDGHSAFAALGGQP